MRQQIGISRNDHLGVALNSKLEKLIVFWIATHTDGPNDFDSFRNAIEKTQEILPFADSDIGVEFGAAEDVGQFD